MDDKAFDNFTQKLKNLKNETVSDETFENYTRELDELRVNFNDLQNERDELKREVEVLTTVNEEYKDKIGRYKRLLTSIFEMIKGIILSFVDKSFMININNKRREIENRGTRRKGKGETSKREKIIENLQEFETDSEPETVRYSDVSDEVGVFGRESMNELEILKYIISEMIKENGALRFENDNYSKGIVKDYSNNMNYNYSKGIIKDRVGALLPDKFKFVWDFLVDNFGDRFLLPVFLVSNSLSHIFVIIMVINYLYYFHDRTLYCTIA